MTRTGKIARLPRDVREELNCRLQDGEEGATLLGWLNSQPGVQEVLSAKFGGRMVSEQNLSAWRQGGYEDWVVQQEIVTQVEELAVNAEELKGVAKKTQLTEHLATLVAVRYAEVLANPNHHEPDEQWERKVRTLRSLCRDVLAMRKSEQRGARVVMEQQRWSFECKDLEEKGVARERSKARAAAMAPFSAQVQQSILAKVHGEEEAARVAEIMHDLPEGTVYYYEDEVVDEGEAQDENEDGGWRMEDGEDLADGHQADGEQEGSSEFRVPGSELKVNGQVLADGHQAVEPNQGESSLIKADQGKQGECGVGSAGCGVGAETSDADLAKVQSSPIKANQGSEMVEGTGKEVEATDGTDFTDSEDGVEGEDEDLAVGQLADGQNEGESSPIKANQGEQGEGEDGGERIEDGEELDAEGDDAEGGDGENGEESTDDGLEEDGGIDIQETALRLATSQMYQILMGFNLQKDLNDSKSFSVIANCLAKLSQSALNIEAFKEDVAEQRHQRRVQRQAELDKDKPRGLSRETIRQMEKALKLL